jgi:hypothetical protein
MQSFCVINIFVHMCMNVHMGWGLSNTRFLCNQCCMWACTSVHMGWDLSNICFLSDQYFNHQLPLTRYQVRVVAIYLLLLPDRTQQDSKHISLDSAWPFLSVVGSEFCVLPTYQGRSRWGIKDIEVHDIKHSNFELITG